MRDSSFSADQAGLAQGLAALLDRPKGDVAAALAALPESLPAAGQGEIQTLTQLAPLVLGGARHLGAETAFAHMDPPTPWIAWVATLWNASVNQNLLHPDVAPVARDLEARVVAWLAPWFGMDGGHLTPGSTIANFTALWAARELAAVDTVIASDTVHLSAAKAAHLLGLKYISVPTDRRGGLDAAELPGDLSRTALVLTAGTTSAGVIDDLGLIGRAAWTHVDAAWAGPLRLSPRYAGLLDGIEQADSVAVSPHKWFFQPKESGLILFRDSAAAHQAVSFNGAYLAVPNVGVLGSHGAAAVPLLATLLAWGHDGIAKRLDQTMALADDLAARLAADPRVELWRQPETAVILWRPMNGQSVDALRQQFPAGMSSATTVDGHLWVRHVAANPNADIEVIWAAIDAALG